MQNRSHVLINVMHALDCWGACLEIGLLLRGGNNIRYIERFINIFFVSKKDECTNEYLLTLVVQAHRVSGIYIKGYHIQRHNHMFGELYKRCKMWIQGDPTVAWPWGQS